MLGNGNLLAIIAAREGSKRLPRKNVKKLLGKPLIAWTIEAGLNSKCVDRVIVSTEDEEIAFISRCYGADVPFVRPAKFATDQALSIDVVCHAVAALEASGEYYEYIMLLQPTSPMRNADHIDSAAALMEQYKLDAIVSVTNVHNNINTSDQNINICRTNDFIRVKENLMRSLSGSSDYPLNGAIYISKASSLTEENTFFPKSGCSLYVMEKFCSIDIDDFEDFESASKLIEENY